MYKTNRIGPSTDSWGIPDITSFQSDFSSFMDKHWHLSVRNSSIHPNIGSVMPKFLLFILAFYGALYPKISWSQCQLLVHHLSVHLSNTSSICRVVDLLLMKPYCLSEKSLFMSMWSIKWSLMILSSVLQITDVRLTDM